MAQNGHCRSLDRANRAAAQDCSGRSTPTGKHWRTTQTTLSFLLSEHHLVANKQQRSITE
jgi:hypothetical protein